MPPTEYEPCIGMVGTRKAREIGMDAAYRIGYGLAAGGMTVVSGGAVGIDGASLTGALDAGGRVVSIQACGLDVDYPVENRELRRRILKTGGMLISEYPPGTPPLPHHFPVRNRLISGMAAGVCVVEMCIRDRPAALQRRGRRRSPPRRRGKPPPPRWAPRSDCRGWWGPPAPLLSLIHIFCPFIGTAPLRNICSPLSLTGASTICCWSCCRCGEATAFPSRS